MERFLCELRDMSINRYDEEYVGAMAYQQKCLEDDIPFLGFFDRIYFPGHPFELSRSV
jgi:hypothetical protein